MGPIQPAHFSQHRPVTLCIDEAWVDLFQVATNLNFNPVFDSSFAFQSDEL